eukprot:CAMPEP_0194217860 /NCGR_PEP_ID=MMETSP0156-20130528/22412_1 /TAXON_ID=33649 /ORGANISM="Thalassionema nitzschioides, Strain L26-B" /LENGTH=85 /DNA_ID=CAMNT_0038947013 /DNA_START=45 /DNA_END=302 /DNA_ORIENTATION=-
MNSSVADETPSMVAASVVTLSRDRRTKRWSDNSPVALAMLSGNKMSNCSDIQTLFFECQASNSEAHICATAARYFENCQSKGAHV